MSTIYKPILQSRPHAVPTHRRGACFAFCFLLWVVWSSLLDLTLGCSVSVARPIKLSHLEMSPRVHQSNDRTHCHHVACGADRVVLPTSQWDYSVLHKIQSNILILKDNQSSMRIQSGTWCFGAWTNESVKHLVHNQWDFSSREFRGYSLWSNKIVEFCGIQSDSGCRDTGWV